MKDFITTFLFIVATVLCLVLILRGIRHNSILKEINETGEIRLYDEVYTCKYKGKWKSEKVFVSKDIIVEEFKNK